MMRIVHELRKAKGTNKKLAILMQNSQDIEWKRSLVAMYDSSINYYVSAPSDNTYVDVGTISYVDMYEILNVLSTRYVTGSAAKKLALAGSKAYGEIFRLILNGSLNAGVSVKTINKAYPCLIPTFPVMLAYDIPVSDYPVLASTKYDGVRVLAFVNSGSAILKTRSGKQLNLKSLETAMAKQSDGVYDGELVSGNGVQKERTAITGFVNKILTGCSTSIENYTYCIFDKVSAEDWSNKKCSESFLTRLRGLNENFISDIHIKIILHNELKEQSEIDFMYESLVGLGYEGIMLRYPQDLYIWDRTDKLIKKKATEECSLICESAIPGSGKYDGMVGSLKCRGYIGGKEVHVNVGSGLTDMDREKPAEYYVGKSIEILYNDIVESKSKPGVYSLFLPRFKRVYGGLDT